MKTLERKCCIMCKGLLSPVYTFKQFPISMGVTTLSSNLDQYEDMIFSKCMECGCIQIKNLIPLEVLYADGHASVIGETWDRHHREFCEFVKKYIKGYIVEIGGANLMVAKRLAQEERVKKITVFDNNILQYQNGQNIPDKISLKEEFFNPTKVKENIDAIIHTHLIEHLYNPLEEILDMSHLLKDGSYMMFAMPLVDEMLKANFTNAMNFEHTYLIDLKVVENILNFCSFEIVEKKNFSPYAAFIIARKNDTIKQNVVNLYPNHSNVFNGFCQYHTNEVKKIKNQINTDKENTFIFGAHIFTQYLFSFGLTPNLFSNILDNDPAKQNNRLYGTQLEVKSPKILKNIEKPLVVLKAAMYTEEIRRDILENINPNTRFIL